MHNLGRGSLFYRALKKTFSLSGWSRLQTEQSHENTADTLYSSFSTELSESPGGPQKLAS